MKKKYQYYDCEIGQRLHRLVVVERLPPLVPGRLSRRFRCRCDCGNFVEHEANYLYTHVKSCGCLASETRAANGRNNRLKNGNASRNSLIAQYRKNCAQERGLECVLTDGEFDVLFAGDCFFCGVPPFRTIRRGSTGTPFTFNGIDRLDNIKGYTSDNVVSCCLQCNRAKGKLSVEEFLAWIKKTHDHTVQTKHVPIVANEGAFRP